MEQHGAIQVDLEGDIVDVVYKYEKEPFSPQEEPWSELTWTATDSDGDERPVESFTLEELHQIETKLHQELFL